MMGSTATSTTTTTTNLVPKPLSTDEKFSQALKTISENPRVGTIPPIKYSVNVAHELAGILGIEDSPWGMIEVKMKARFPSGTTQSEVNENVKSRLKRNLGRYCSTCRDVHPVFYNVEQVVDDSSYYYAPSSSRRSSSSSTGAIASFPFIIRPSSSSSSSPLPTTNRLLLQESTNNNDDYEGVVSLMVSYQDRNNMLLFSEVFKSLLDTSYSDQALEQGAAASAGSVDVQDFLKTIQPGQIVVESIDVQWDTSNTTYIVRDVFDSKRSDEKPLLVRIPVVF